MFRDFDPFLPKGFTKRTDFRFQTFYENPVAEEPGKHERKRRKYHISLEQRTLKTRKKRKFHGTKSISRSIVVVFKAFKTMFGGAHGKLNTKTLFLG